MNDKEFFKELAQNLKCEPAALKAVEDVESAGRGGFLPSGRPQILFEGHQFYKRLKEYQSEAFAKQVQSRFPDICYPKWDRKKYKGGEAEWERLTIARSIDQIMADMSTSWGIGQIMGFNYAVCGCDSVTEFVERMSKSKEEQAKLWFNALKNTPSWINPLRKKDWASFAKAYNGPGYKQNNYDTKLASAYSKYVKLGYNL